MDADRFARLAPRHRECLRLVRQLKSSKQIAAELGIAPGTVDGYLTEAAEIIGVRGRAAAANALAEHESALPQGDMLAVPSRNPPPENPGVETAGVVEAPVSLAFPVSPDRADPVAPAPSPTGAAPVSGFRLPLRRQGEVGNDLSMGQRLLWIPALALASVVGFGTLVTALETLTGLLGRVWKLPT
ncbi:MULTISPECIES: helix-turn-helix transcriptional regulator [unclassified Sphingomonas]|uniref:helix-turn-helix domain-containing protein n=1 Tax=unclassified Sphingomonas TaxID=196159 RepID=UPI00286C8F08|nr:MULTISPECIES: helix-turn-helix transcriptional regulator [unclassified Sphingomonas]